MDSIDPRVALQAPGGAPDAATARRSARRFGLGALLVLGAAGAWTWLGRGHVGYGVALLGAGSGLFLLGLVRPTLALRVRDGWMRGARAVGAVNTVLLLGALYLLAVVPVGLLRRLLGQDSLRSRRPDAPTFWHSREQRADRARFERPF